jgi:hypothetical protein
MCRSVDWSSDGKFLATVATTSNGVIVYELINDVLNPISVDTIEGAGNSSVNFTK